MVERRRDAAQCGQAVIEFAFFLPLIILLLVVIQQSSVLISAAINVGNVARVAADAAAAASDCVNSTINEPRLSTNIVKSFCPEPSPISTTPASFGTCPSANCPYNSAVYAACQASLRALGLPFPGTCATGSSPALDKPLILVSVQCKKLATSLGHGNVGGCGQCVTCSNVVCPSVAVPAGYCSPAPSCAPNSCQPTCSTTPNCIPNPFRDVGFITVRVVIKVDTWIPFVSNPTVAAQAAAYPVYQ